MTHYPRRAPPAAATSNWTASRGEPMPHEPLPRPRPAHLPHHYRNRPIHTIHIQGDLL